MFNVYAGAPHLNRYPNAYAAHPGALARPRDIRPFHSRAGPYAEDVDVSRPTPLGDGHHILFVDPRAGLLCMGSDASSSATTRLRKKIVFRPPPEATSLTPTTFAVAPDVRHGVRIAAVFPTSYQDANDEGQQQVLVSYSVPRDIMRTLSSRRRHSVDMPHGGPRDIMRTLSSRRRHSVDMPHGGHWRSGYRHHDWGRELLHPFEHHSSRPPPLDVEGMTVTTCTGIVRLAVETRPYHIVWAWSADGWGRSWRMDGRHPQLMSRSPFNHLERAAYPMLESSARHRYELPHQQPAMRRSTHPRLMRHAYPRGRVLREVDAEADIEMLDAEPIIEEYARRDEYPIDAYDGAPTGGMPPLALPPSQGNSSCQYPSLAVGPVVPVPKPKKKVVDTVTVDLGGAVKRIARMDIELR